MLNYDGMESTSLNDTESESNTKPTVISHHARIKDKLKLLKSNLKIKN